jgi:hypothetical protein
MECFVKSTYIKLVIALVLFLAWVLLVAFKVPDVGDLVAFIKTALEGLGLYHAVTWGNDPAPSTPAAPVSAAASAPSTSAAGGSPQ